MPPAVQRDLWNDLRVEETVFRRSPGGDLLIANAAKGLCAVQLSRDLDVRHNTAFMLVPRLLEAMTAATRGLGPEGGVDVDGAAFGGHVRPANLREQRVDRRRLANRGGTHRAGVVLRQRGGRTLARTFLRKAQGAGFSRDRIASDTMVSADEIAHRDLLEPESDMRKIGRSETCIRAGAHTIPAAPRASFSGAGG